MKHIVSKCGNRCDLCGLYKDNIAEVDMEEFGRIWKKLFGTPLTHEQSEPCDGVCRHDKWKCDLKECKESPSCRGCGKFPSCAQYKDMPRNFGLDISKLSEREYQILEPYLNYERLLAERADE